MDSPTRPPYSAVESISSRPSTPHGAAAGRPLANTGFGSKTAVVSPASGAGAPTWSWVVVHQAIGMTMEYLDCSGAAAFEALMTRAGATGQTVSDVSADVVERRFRFRAIPGW